MASNAELLQLTQADRRVAELNRVVALRDEELSHLEAQLDAQRNELQALYRQTASVPLPAPKEPKAGPLKPLIGGAARGGATAGSKSISWGERNKVAEFTRGSSPREFGNQKRHEELKQQLGIKS